ncbi:hypothetical protein K438DRAFT_1634402, partial [Mycena galopus ATCC 62051]
LWIRRYRLDRTWRAGFKKKRLFRLEFVPDSDPDAFGFLNPDEVIRGAHIIPAFSTGTTEALLSSGSIGRLPRFGLTDDEDWRYYYVNMQVVSLLCVDRDMYMRYRGGGVGHYQIPIPAEDGPQDQDSGEDDDSGQPEPMVLEPEIPPAPPITPPQTPEPEDEFPAHLSLSDSRPGSSLSENSDKSHDSNGSTTSVDSAEGSGDDDSEVEEPDLGPEDGLGDLEEEVEEGYAVL